MARNCLGRGRRLHLLAGLLRRIAKPNTCYLVFLPGVSEIENVAMELNRTPPPGPASRECLLISAHFAPPWRFLCYISIIKNLVNVFVYFWHSLKPPLKKAVLAGWGVFRHPKLTVLLCIFSMLRFWMDSFCIYFCFFGRIYTPRLVRCSIC